MRVASQRSVHVRVAHTKRTVMRGCALATLGLLALVCVPSAQAATFEHEIMLRAGGATAKGYRVSLEGDFSVAGYPGDSVSLNFSKEAHGVYEGHRWVVPLESEEVAIDPALASVKVRHQLGRRGEDGEIKFTFTGTPTSKSGTCGRTITAARGPLTGTIRLKLHDRFFGTITIHKMSGVAEEPPAWCGSPCLNPYSAVRAVKELGITRPMVELEAETEAPRPRPAGTSVVTVSVSDPVQGTPFSGITHTITVASRKRLVTVAHNLGTARIGVSTSQLAGTLVMRARSRVHPDGWFKCGRGRVQEFTARSATVVHGRLTAHFDSIGQVTLDKNLNGRLPNVNEIFHA